tara:strand:+ start:253 stop:462 length:210 start_codon:yes stop_codon:yes gene_type:complete
MRPRCLHCHRLKAISGTGYCRRHQREAAEVEAAWQTFVGLMKQDYEDSTGRLAVAGSAGWRDWIKRMFP